MTELNISILEKADKVVRADLVIRADGSPPIVDGYVAILGSGIAAVGAVEDLGPEVRSGLDAVSPAYKRGATLLPGLIDAHAHVTLAGDGRSYERMAADRDELLALAAVHNMHRHLAAGVTTIRDNGGRNLIVFAVREAINRGYIPGPRLLLSGRPVTHTLGHFHWCNGVADTVDEIRTAVRRLVAEAPTTLR